MDISEHTNPRTRIEKGYPNSPRGVWEWNFRLYRQSKMMVYGKKFQQKKGRGLREGCMDPLDVLHITIPIHNGHMGILYIHVFCKIVALVLLFLF